MTLETTKYTIEVISPKQSKASIKDLIDSINWMYIKNVLLYSLVYANLIMLLLNVIKY